MSKRDTITIPTVGSSGGRTTVNGLDDFAKDFRKLPKEIQKQIRRAAKESVGDIVKDAQGRADRGEKQQPAMRRAIRAEFFKGAPAIVGGGSKKVNIGSQRSGGRRGVSAGVLFVGAEFGAKKLRQFPRRTPRLGRGNEGDFFYPAIRKALEGGAIIKNFVGQIDSAIKRII